MSHGFSRMSTPPPSYGAPPPGYGVPPPGYGAAPPPPKNNTAKIVLIVLGVVFGVGIFGVAILAAILFPVFQKVRGNARLASCKSNVRLIDLDLMEYVQDNNGKLPPSAADYKSAIYVKEAAIFHCPADTPGAESYSMNTTLQGVSIDKIAQPDRVVTLYEGKNQTLDFRHDGKAVVGFADGGVRTVTPAEAQGLKWEP